MRGSGVRIPSAAPKPKAPAGPGAFPPKRTAPAIAGAEPSMDDGLTAPWPYRALLGTAHDLTHALEHELLDAFSFEGLGRVDVALGIHGDAVHAVELAGLASAAAERGQFVHRGAL